jgi:hypothetical protein
MGGDRKCEAREMKKLALLMMLGVISTCAIGEWVHVAKAANGEMFYVDPMSIKKVGNNHRAWVMVNNNTPDPRGAMSARHLMEFKCAEDSYKPLAITTYSEKFASGNIVRHFNAKDFPDWEYLVPGSTMEGIASLVCKRNL